VTPLIHNAKSFILFRVCYGGKGAFIPWILMADFGTRKSLQLCPLSCEDFIQIGRDLFIIVKRGELLLQ
jgi:hypothetical protein